jgi:hypothetical protein
MNGAIHMAKDIPVRVMDQPQDYLRMGTQPGVIEV